MTSSGSAAANAEPVAMEGALMRELFSHMHSWMQEIGENVDSELDRIEGRRFILRMLGLSVESYIEGWDADAPHFRQAVSDIRKVFADSPDTDYMRSSLYLRGGRIFRIRGTIPATTLYWGVQLYRSGGMVGKNLADVDIPLDHEGSFDLYIVPPNIPLSTFLQGKKVLVGDGDEVAVIVRQYFIDRTKEPPMRLSIQRVHHNNEDVNEVQHGHTYDLLAPQGKIKSADFARGARLALSDIKSTFKKTMLAHQYLSSACDFTFVIPEAKQLFPTNDNRYTCGWVYGLEQDIGADDYPVILVRGKRPNVRYFSVVLYNRWLESLDYTRATVYRNHTKITFEADGSFEVAIARKNPGHKNYLNSLHHDGVYVLFRELLWTEAPMNYTVKQTTFKQLRAQKASL